MGLKFGVTTKKKMSKFCILSLQMNIKCPKIDEFFRTLWRIRAVSVNYF